MNVGGKSLSLFQMMIDCFVYCAFLFHLGFCECNERALDGEALVVDPISASIWLNHRSSRLADGSGFGTRDTLALSTQDLVRHSLSTDSDFVCPYIKDEGAQSPVNTNCRLSNDVRSFFARIFTPLWRVNRPSSKKRRTCGQNTTDR